MRWILGLLLIANLVMFGWGQGWLDRWGGAMRALPTETMPERLRVVPLDRLGALPADFEAPGKAGRPLATLEPPAVGRAALHRQLASPSGGVRWGLAPGPRSRS